MSYLQHTNKVRKYSIHTINWVIHSADANIHINSSIGSQLWTQCRQGLRLQGLTDRPWRQGVHVWHGIWRAGPYRAQQWPRHPHSECGFSRGRRGNSTLPLHQWRRRGHCWIHWMKQETSTLENGVEQKTISHLPTKEGGVIVFCKVGSSCVELPCSIQCSSYSRTQSPDPMSDNHTKNSSRSVINDPARNCQLYQIYISVYWPVR